MLSYGRMKLSQLTLNVVETSSSEPTLIMLHGVTRCWQTFLPIVPALAMRHRLLLVDFRGHGLSDRATSGYAVADYVDDITELIERHIEGPVDVYGHSLGAMTAAGVAARLGNRLSAIVMEDPPLQTMGTRIGLTPLLSYFSGIAQFAGHTLSVAEAARNLADVRFHDPGTGETFRVGDTRNNAQLRFAAASLQHLDPRVFDSMLQSEWLTDYDIDDIFSSMDCPALLLQADYSAGGMLTDEDVAHVSKLARNMSHVQFSGVPHGIHWTATEALLNTVLPFLESVR